MGLLSIIRKVKAREQELRVLVLGLDDAGKTTVVKNLTGDDVRTVSPTLGFEIRTLEHGASRIHLWDVGGQKTIRAYWRNYFEQTDGLVWVVDSADRMRLDICRTELHTLLNEERMASAVLLVLANKQDLPGALSPDQIAQVLGLSDTEQTHPASNVNATRIETLHEDDAMAYARLGDRSWRVVGCSAVQAESAHFTKQLADGFTWLIDEIRDRDFSLS
ncbi:ADP-ribosylation factor-like protein 2 [Porphyridium purpureum]|uniref:ADP-ribosylation factor-like protein 2 n=1 Tax=Porphyridium purpureum TaxID=35688 RepID=A0A5J4YQ90_PORPP|nr:ADP-ribosylation factor-like protein 2 [Porphyridium purpureum]|eukprot:POR1686..scf222_8